jgi:hypothetical protein
LRQLVVAARSFLPEKQTGPAQFIGVRPPSWARQHRTVADMQIVRIPSSWDGGNGLETNLHTPD